MEERKKGRKEVLFVSFALTIFVGVLHHYAMLNFWYWLYWWFDILMHFLGGLLVSIIAIWVYYFSGFFSGVSFNKKNLLKFSIIAVLVVGISWEVFEIIIKETINEPDFISDTFLDLILDLVGAFVAYRYIAYNFLENKNGKNG